MLRYQGQIVTIHRNGKAIRIKQNNKTAARKRYEEGKEIFLHPCLMRLDSPWQSPCPISKATYPDGFVPTFDSLVYDFKYYNCDSERGAYPIFFVEVDK